MGVGTGVRVSVGVGVGVWVLVAVGVSVGQVVAVGVGVAVGEGVLVGVGTAVSASKQSRGQLLGDSPYSGSQRVLLSQPANLRW